VPRARARADSGHNDIAPELARNRLGVGFDDADQRSTDRPEPGNADAKRSSLFFDLLGIPRHTLNNTLARISPRFTPVAQIENELRITGKIAPETSRRPPVCGKKSFD